MPGDRAWRSTAVGLLVTLAVISSAGCSDVAFGISTRGFDGRANIVIVFGQELIVVTRLISSSGTGGSQLHTTIDVSSSRGDPSVDLAADSVWVTAGSRTWTARLARVAGEDGTMRLSAIAEGPTWPPGTRADVRIRLRRADRTHDLELTDLRVERP